MDIDPPVCALRSVGDCSFSGDTCGSTWRVSWYILDRGSPIYKISPLSNTTSVQYIESQAEHVNQRILVTADIPCCVNGEVLTVTDFSGNKANCSVTKTSGVPQCTTDCRNGGLCVGTNQCICRGGYYGALCENGKIVNWLNLKGHMINTSVSFSVGCPNPLAPANGYVVSSSSYSTGDRAEWICNDGYEIIGRNTTICCPFGWTGALPQCVPPDTPTPTSKPTSTSRKTSEALPIKSYGLMTAVLGLLVTVGL